MEEWRLMLDDQVWFGEEDAEVWRLEGGLMLGDGSWVFLQRAEEGFLVEFSRSLSSSLNSGQRC